MTQTVVKQPENSRKRHNISMDEETRKRAEELAELEKRSVSNLLEVLVDREWSRLHPEPGQTYLSLPPKAA